MADMSQPEPRRLYSWWWDSHIPKNSKWIQENLEDMDSKVKTMIKLIEADADSFARRAEMYYKKRPELMKLVEELYRAYRALAERYDHTTVQLRRAHKAMVEAFPNQVPSDTIEDSAYSSSSATSKLKDSCESSVSQEADTEVEDLKKTLLELQTEKEALNLQYQLSLKELSRFEKELKDAQKEVIGFEERSCKAEIEIKVLKESLAKVEVERDTGIFQYNQSMERITDLEATVSREQEHAKELKKELSRFESEKEAGLLRYNKCLELISALQKKLRDAEESVEMFKDRYEIAENEIKSLKRELVKINEVNEDLERKVSQVQDNDKRLSSEVLAGSEKIKTVEEQCGVLERFNQTLKVEADDLSNKMLVKDQELVYKQKELEKLQALMQEDQKVLTLELQSKIQTLRGFDIQNHEISCLKKMKEKLEEEVAKHMNHSSSLQVEIHLVKGNIDDLNRRYQELIEQVKLTGFDPESLVYSVKKLQEENSKLLELCNNQRDDKIALQEKLCEIDKLLLESNTKLNGFKEKAEDLQERCESLQEEKAEVVVEKANLFSQLQIMTINMQKLLEQNSLLEKSLSNANIELQSLRDKSKYFEDFFLSLKNDKSELIKDKDSLVSQLYKVEEKLRVSEKKFTELERDTKLKDLQVEEFKISLATEKQSNETRLLDLQKNVSFLREECISRKRDFEEELERVVNKQVEIFILQKLIEESEQKNLTLMVECEKHVEASEFSEKLISELESENLEQQMEAEILLDEIDSLKNAIYQIVKALQVEANYKSSSVSSVLGEINELKCSLSGAEDETHRLVVENSVLLSLLEQEQKLRSQLQTENSKFETLNESHVALKQDYSDTLVDNKALLLKFSELKDGMCVVEEEKDQILLEALALSNMCVVYRSFGSEMAKEAETSIGRKHKVKALEEKLKGKEEETQELNKVVEKLQEGLEEEDFLNGIEKVEAERKISELANLAERQEEEIAKLNTLNMLLQEEIQEREVREEFLSLELQERSNEVGLWDADATSFYFDLQISSIRGIFLENKVEELNGICENLKEEMKEKVGFLESQVTELKTQLKSSYDPLVASLESGSGEAVLEDKDKRLARQRAQSASHKRRDQKKIEEIQLEDKVSADQITSFLFSSRSQGSSCGSNSKESVESETSINIEDKAKIMDRLLSDSRRLSSLMISLSYLKIKVEMNEKEDRFSNSDLVIVKRQLKEMEETVEQLTNTNEILTKEIEETCDDARDLYRKVVIEKSRNGSEKIEQLQSKMESIEETVTKLEDGSKSKRSKTLSESRTLILLRDIIHKGGHRSARKKKKKNRFCGCIRSSDKEE